MSRSGRRRRKPSRAGLIAGLGGASGALLLLVVAVAAWSAWTYAGPGPAAADGPATTVILSKGSGVSGIADTLETAGVIRSGGLFATAARLTGAATRLQAGEYLIPSRASMAAIIADVRAGKVVRHLVTIPEGWTSDMAVDALLASDVLTGPVAAPPEGSILPDTYQVQRGDSRVKVMNRMRRAHDALLAELWPRRAPGLPIATPDEAVTLASIVEKETGVAAERPRVAAVFMNRLRIGMRLQSDPTIIYHITRGRPLGRGIRASELADVNPYNSYQVAGLPPTPIANPGRAAIAAVLNPPKTGDLYFVADGTGGHAFAADLATHERNVARWREIERAKAK